MQTPIFLNPNFIPKNNLKYIIRGVQSLTLENIENDRVYLKLLNLDPGPILGPQKGIKSSTKKHIWKMFKKGKY